ncbi:MAG: putative thiamine biosynthesis lipoprotein ApbE, partial [Proteobacteria bacterium]|nr:putative thiamine biosynthesis lipoprotein ApbE [Pseudomonadota bacterium]
LMASVDLYQGAIASSGDYERCIRINGQRYGHILSPKTGWPVQGLVAVSVMTPHCLVAGSGCTIAMLKEKDGPQWLQHLGLAYVCMDREGRITSA